MGRGHARGRRQGGGGGNRGQVSAEDRAKGWNNFSTLETKNAAFEEYYKNQGILAEDEWDTFMAKLRTELPLTFRVTGSRAHAETISDIIRTTYVPTMQNVEHEGKKYDPPQQIDWYPGGLGWQINAPKRVVRKSLPFKNFQRFLVGETEVGNLSRQEAVSMIPPLFLEVEPHHKCLDMCAAPGSKTAQIIEALNPHHATASGLLIANDSDYKRTHMLVHQTGRMPSKGLIVTNYDASMLPNISLGSGKTLVFDRILADVPCSGDGTLRKNLEIWGKWAASDGNSLHGLQLRILQRGMNLLAPGGRLVYSTCSFNPVEDEAVIAAALNANPDFSILDVSLNLPELVRRPGRASWKVATQPDGKNGPLVWQENFEEYRKRADEGSEREQDKFKGLAETAWPPANAKDLGLEKCMRLYPHDQNTGGFFVCVLQKAGTPPATSGTTEPVPAPPPAEEILPVEDAVVADETGTSSLKRAAPSPPPESAEAIEAKKPRQQPPQGRKQRRDIGFKEEPFSYVDSGHKEVQSLVDWFKLDERFPRGNLLVRNDYGDPLRTLYLTNDIVKAVMLNNEYSRLRVITAGVKAFVRQDSQAKRDVDDEWRIECKWRIPNEGVGEIVPHIGEGVVRDVGLDVLKVLLEEQYPTVSSFPSDAQKWLDSAKLGNIIVRVSATSTEHGHLPLALDLPVWKAKTSVSLLIDKREKSMLSLRVFGEDICKAPPLKKDLVSEDEVEAAHLEDREGNVAEGVVVDEEAAENA